jgi:hypothetical protein
MNTTLTFTYGPLGRESIEYACDHGRTEMGAAELYHTPEGFVALSVKHLSRTGCECRPEVMVRRWPDARVALAMFEAMAADLSGAVDALDAAVMAQDLADLRARVPCPGCIVAWTATSAAGGKLERQFTHARDCPDHRRRVRDGADRPTYAEIARGRVQ